MRPSPRTHHRRASDITPTPSPTQDPSLDTFRVEYLVGPCAVLALIFNYAFTPSEILWSFSIFLEAVAILPQLFILQRTGEAETITTHYLAALGAYRALYIPNWIYRYFSEGQVDPIAIVAGLVQTGLYLDFFYVYVTKYVARLPLISCANPRPGSCTGKSSSCLHERIRTTYDCRRARACCLNYLMDDGPRHGSRR